MTLAANFEQAGFDRDEIAARAVAEDALIAFGYGALEFATVNGEFVATAVKTVSANQYRAQAIGRTRRAAAQALVSTITRR